MSQNAIQNHKASMNNIDNSIPLEWTRNNVTTCSTSMTRSRARLLGNDVTKNNECKINKELVSKSNTSISKKNRGKRQRVSFETKKL